MTHGSLLAQKLLAVLVLTALCCTWYGCGDSSTEDQVLGAVPTDAAQEAPDASSAPDAFMDAKADPGADAGDGKDVSLEADALSEQKDDVSVEADSGIPEASAEADPPDGAPPVCTTCHGDPIHFEAAPPKDTHGNLSTSDRGVGAHQAHRRAAKADQHIPHGPIACASCHIVPGDVNESGHMDSSPGAEVTWSGLALASNAQPTSWKSNVDTTCTGVYCHGATLKGGTLKQPVWTTVDGSQAGCGSCHGTPPATGHPKDKKCNKCHSAVIADCPDDNPSNCVFQDDVSATQSYKLHINGQIDVSISGCTGCHGAPPNNGAHAIHAGAADPPTAYGSLEPRPNAASYSFNCGYCHPLQGAAHMDGVVQVELFNASAPPAPTDPNSPADRRSIKRANPAAAYTPGTTTYPGEIADFTDGTCSSVYCHSEQVEAAPSVPLADAAKVAPLKFSWMTVDAFANSQANTCCQQGPENDYPSFPITVSRVYRNPKWAGETYSGVAQCSHCHGYPPRTSPPDNEGAGDSHSFKLSQAYGGYEQGHFYNMGAGWPVQCHRCHRATVSTALAPSGWHYDSATWDFIYDAPTPIAGFADHVNGKKDVAFDLSPPGCGSGQPDLQYPSVKCLLTATWNPATRSCSNVECHLQQDKVTWGAPYRDVVATECNACHQY